MQSLDIKTAARIIAPIINEWDPYGLIAGGAPSDEFASEIHTLACRARFIQTAEDAAREIAAVFGAAFEPERFTVASCADVGRRLYSAITAAHAPPEPTI